VAPTKQVSFVTQEDLLARETGSACLPKLLSMASSALIMVAFEGLRALPVAALGPSLRFGYRRPSSFDWPNARRKDFGARVRALRLKCRLAQEDMMDHGFDIRHYQRIEAGRSVTLWTVWKLAQAFKVSPRRTESQNRWNLGSIPHRTTARHF
jgi:hypothetical protein